MTQAADLIDLSEERQKRAALPQLSVDPKPPAGSALPSEGIPLLVDPGGIVDASVERDRGHASVLAVLASAVAHFAIGVALFLPVTPAPLGVGGQALDAVSIEVVSVEELRRRASTAPPDGGPVEQPEVVAAPAPPEKSVEKRPPEAIEKPVPTPTAEIESPAAEIVKPEPRTEPAEPKPETERQVEKKVEQPRTADLALPQPALTAGAPAAEREGERDAADRDTVARAAPGQMAKYAIDVRQALGRSRPQHYGLRGSVIIRFSVDRSGGLTAADVTHSSGQTRLDQLALTAVRAARFPTPPPNMTEADRTYVVPFDFK